MDMININSNYGYINTPGFYIGWKNIHDYAVNGDCGDEIFGIAFGDYYLGYYEDGKWSYGKLDKNGCLSN